MNTLIVLVIVKDVLIFAHSLIQSFDWLFLFLNYVTGELMSHEKMSADEY